MRNVNSMCRNQEQGHNDSYYELNGSLGSGGVNSFLGAVGTTAISEPFTGRCPIAPPRPTLGLEGSVGDKGL